MFDLENEDLFNESNLSKWVENEPFYGPYKSEYEVENSRIFYLNDMVKYLKEKENIQIKIKYNAPLEEYFFEIIDLKNNKIIDNGASSSIYTNVLNGCVDKAFDYLTPK